jgi:hypothetical protein
MAYNFGSFAANHKVEIRIFFVTSNEEDAGRFAARFANVGYRIVITWVHASQSAIDDITASMCALPSFTPTAIILDYSSFGGEMSDVLQSMRQAIGDRYVEYVVFDVPDVEFERSELHGANTTIVPLDISLRS